MKYCVSEILAWILLLLIMEILLLLLIVVVVGVVVVWMNIIIIIYQNFSVFVHTGSFRALRAGCRVYTGSDLALLEKHRFVSATMGWSRFDPLDQRFAEGLFPPIVNGTVRLFRHTQKLSPCVLRQEPFVWGSG